MSLIFVSMPGYITRNFQESFLLGLNGQLIKYYSIYAIYTTVDMDIIFIAFLIAGKSNLRKVYFGS